ncbi:MAG: hypothetical protein A2Z95_00525 [Gallionellales bacterium GWA2_60_18]|nr:MAG: hypothetical protein A2Z95_00525 [Gallionellales bacterium GWA2_60_18]
MNRLAPVLYAWLLLCVAPPVLAAAPSGVQATYDVYRDGLKVGQIEETYTRDHERYTLSSTTTPTGLLAVFRPEKIFIESAGLIGQQGLQPERFSHRRERDENKDSRAEFDWKERHLALTQQAQRILLELPDGTQDRLSAMYQFMFLPLQKAAALDFAMTNGSKLDHYHYAISRGQKLKTPAGEFRTLYLDNQAGAGENRTEIWLAVQHHNLPCKMVITDADGEQLTQVLSRLIVVP